ncbi:MAG TPA: hypothetical protein VK447_21030, partial [Myxococcaceae bacterium]|nr:hypothetical protein [Myxococcaceae bacterium]
MTERPVLTPELREGRRALDGVPDVELTGAIAWEPRACRWVLPLRLRADVPADSAIPEWTRWYAHLESTYPFGNIDVLPSKVEGLDKTYPHQRLNEDGSDGLPWRDGRLCLQTWLASLGERGREEEPVTPGGRLAWHVQRARE